MLLTEKWKVLLEGHQAALFVPQWVMLSEDLWEALLAVELAELSEVH